MGCKQSSCSKDASAPAEPPDARADASAPPDAPVAGGGDVPVSWLSTVDADGLTALTAHANVGVVEPRWLLSRCLLDHVVTLPELRDCTVGDTIANSNRVADLRDQVSAAAALPVRLKPCVRARGPGPRRFVCL